MTNDTDGEKDGRDAFDFNGFVTLASVVWLLLLPVVVVVLVLLLVVVVLLVLLLVVVVDVLEVVELENEVVDIV